MIGLDLSTRAKLAVKWATPKWYYVVELILESVLNYFNMWKNNNFRLIQVFITISR